LQSAFKRVLSGGQRGLPCVFGRRENGYREKFTFGRSTESESGVNYIRCFEPIRPTVLQQKVSGGIVLVQREMERGRSPLVSIPPCGRGFSRHRGLPIRCGFSKSAEAKPPRSVHRLDEPTGLSLSMVASPQCRFRFARQNHCSAAATRAANFRIPRNSGPISFLTEKP